MQWFAAENPQRPSGDNAITGCLGPSDQYVKAIDEAGHEPTNQDCANGDSRCQRACYNHPTLVDVFNGQTPKISWKWYSQKPADLWTAPTAMQNICVPSPNMPSVGIVCLGSGWHDNLAQALPTQNPVEQAPMLRDIENCSPDFSFPQVAWVTPDGHWSDHAGRPSNPNKPRHDGGPSWVAAIVNAVGNNCPNDQSANQHAHWNNTVILITWDDWGGWFDHVGPFRANGYQQGDPNGQYYVYGFRVPLLVVSAYTKQVTTQGGYISGIGNPSCPGPYCHDFGSILNFVEYTFGSSGNSLPQIGDASFPYADHFAPDAFPQCPLSQCPYALSDFFGDFSQPHAFTAINGAKYPEYCFRQPDQTGCFPGFTPADPDNDAGEMD